ncbi:uas [Niveomyces insectorum RCEF 264]|uniref:Uas n=1 Tax=Niveomyces insectorum RCEF 264 TaxID=1081102 RepID=A0A167M4U6_9HYPO|nr:uas [Niveomyces insectorum RCEF 264]
MDDDLVTNLMAVTGTSGQVARQLLEMANGDLSQAAVLFYDTDMAETLARQSTATAPAIAANTATSSTAPFSSTTTSTTAGAVSGSRSRSHQRSGRSTAAVIGHEDDEGIIHLDSDDEAGGADFEEIDEDDEDPFDNARDSQMTDAAAAVTVARTAQEEEDEAMAKRLQEEMYAETAGGGSVGGGGAASTTDGIRAPMGRTTEVLVEPSYGGLGGGAGIGGVGGYSDFGETSLFEQMRRRRRARGPANPFDQVWDEEEGGVGGSSSRSSSTAPQQVTARQARLADLFRPPYELIEHLSWDEARTVGKTEKRWILANIQDMSDFACQALNRDVWKDEAVKQLVKENFVFLQYNKDDPAAESYIQYYLPGGQHENPDNYPHVAVIDPRTGEQVKVWSGRPFPSALDFHAQLAEFLDRYSLDASKKNPVQRTKPPAPSKDVDRMTEEEMLEMALKNSLETAGVSAEGGGRGDGSGGDGSSSSTMSRRSVRDPDELTTVPGTPGGAAGAAGAGEEEDDESAASAAAFARISSDRSHTEPAANVDPSSTTRIQFRHPAGRVIRRFVVDDPVVRLYEWLKADPLEGKSGVAFELKAMPQGHDLLEDLDKTIGEAGLKQATVMIEFLD